MENHGHYMQRCHELAAIAAMEGESPVGSILVKDNKVLGEAYEKSRQLKDITRHAEVLAIIDTLEKGHSCAGAILYTTTEPCILCSYVIRHHKIAVIVYERPCGELGGTGPLFNLLTTTRVSSWGATPEVINYIPG
jgi:tRNA(adenine34) deaminase